MKKLLHALLTQDRALPGGAEAANAKRGMPRKRRLSRGTARNALVVLRACLNHAVEEGVLAANPAIRLGRLLRSKEEPEERKADFLTADELSKVLATCRESKPRYFPFVLTLARTGLRLGEAVALKWGDIDFNGRFIQVVRNFTGGRFTTPKSGRGRRVDISQGLATVLRAELVKARERALEEGRPEPVEWVFTDPQGGRIDGCNFRNRVWGPLLQKAGLRRIRIHDLRHT